MFWKKILKCVDSGSAGQIQRNVVEAFQMCVALLTTLETAEGALFFALERVLENADSFVRENLTNIYISYKKWAHYCRREDLFKGSVYNWIILRDESTLRIGRLKGERLVYFSWESWWQWSVPGGRAGTRGSPVPLRSGCPWVWVALPGCLWGSESVPFCC